MNDPILPHKALFVGDKESTIGAIFDAFMETDCEREMIEKIGITKEQFTEAIMPHDVIGIKIRGELAGGVFINGEEMHIGIKRKFHAVWARYLKPLMAYIFEKHGSPLYTAASKQNRHANEFLQRAGCHVCGEDLDTWHYRIVPEEINYGLGKRSKMSRG